MISAHADGRRAVGVVTVTRNSESVIGDFLDSVQGSQRASAYAIRLYVVDNASSDGTVAAVRSRGAVQLLVQATNTGAAAGNNIGIRAALTDGCQFILLVNNDTVFDPLLADRLLHTSLERAASVVAPMICDHQQPPRIWYAGGKVSPLRAFRVTHHGLGAPLSAYPSRPTAYAPTTCLLVEASVFRRTGLLDESYFIYCEDVDLCLRLISHGFVPFFDSAAILTHKVSSLTGGPNAPFGADHSTMGRVLLVRRLLRGWRAGLALTYLLGWIVARCAARRDTVPVTRARLLGALKGLRAPLLPVPSAATEPAS